jgi:hypothetical protein
MLPTPERLDAHGTAAAQPVFLLTPSDRAWTSGLLLRWRERLAAMGKASGRRCRSQNFLYSLSLSLSPSPSLSPSLSDFNLSHIPLVPLIPCAPQVLAVPDDNTLGDLGPIIRSFARRLHEARRGNPGRPLVLVGFGLGCKVAVQIASQNAVDGVVCLAPPAPGAMATMLE